MYPRVKCAKQSIKGIVFFTNYSQTHYSLMNKEGSCLAKGNTLAGVVYYLSKDVTLIDHLLPIK